MKIVDREKVKQIPWNGDPAEYDLNLFKLGNESTEFIVPNPNIAADLNKVIKTPPKTNRCVVWYYNDQWVAKKFSDKWKPEYGYLDIPLPNSSFKFNFLWIKNPDIDSDIEYEYDPYRNYKINLDEAYYELVWYLDPRFCPNQEKIWAVRCKNQNQPCLGTKDMGFISPKMKIDYNKLLPSVKYDLEFNIPWWDLKYTHTWMLDSKHCENAVEDIWAVKVNFCENTIGEKIIGEASPIHKIEYNPELPKLNYNVDYTIPYHDLGYEHVWMLDKKHTLNLEEEIWAYKIVLTDKPVGTKIVDYVSPKTFLKVNKDVEGYNVEIPHIDIQYHDLQYQHIWMLDKDYSENYNIWAVKLTHVRKTKKEKLMGAIIPKQKIKYNPKIKNLKIKIDYKIPYYDRNYEHIWYIDEEFTENKKIWGIKLSACKKPIGSKEMGKIVPLTQELDVIFISYREENAEKNWQRVLEKAPHAKRVKGIKGIFNAHKEAAKIAQTDMFYVVDGDAYLVDGWEFDFKPSFYDRNCCYVWQSINPINGLIYQNGGVKLFSKKNILSTKEWTTLDMTNGIMPGVKAEEKISCFNNFNADPFSTWRSAFRESVKLYTLNQFSKLNTWQTIGKGKPFGEYAIRGALEGEKFAEKNIENKEKLLLINDFDWLKRQFKKSNNAV